MAKELLSRCHPLLTLAPETPPGRLLHAGGECVRSAFPSQEAQKDFQGTFGMTIDKQDRIWFIEPASFDFKHTRVSAFDLNTKKRVEFFEFPEGQAKFAEDIRVTADGKYVILPNPGLFSFTTPSVVVYSVLNQESSTRSGVRRRPFSGYETVDASAGIRLPIRRSTPWCGSAAIGVHLSASIASVAS